MKILKALQERWDVTRQKAMQIGEDLKQKASRWAVVEPLATEVENRLSAIAQYIDNRKSDRVSSY